MVADFHSHSPQTNCRKTNKIHKNISSNTEKKTGPKTNTDTSAIKKSESYGCEEKVYTVDCRVCRHDYWWIFEIVRSSPPPSTTVEFFALRLCSCHLFVVALKWIFGWYLFRTAHCIWNTFIMPETKKFDAHEIPKESGKSRTHKTDRTDRTATVN